MQNRSIQKQKRNRKRSKRRQIFCPKHLVLMDSVSQKFPLYAEYEQQLRQRGIGRKTARQLVASSNTIALKGEWLEEFWCEECQERKWFHILKVNGRYTAKMAPCHLWKQASGVVNTQGNPTVSQFTRRHSRAQGNQCIKDFNFVSAK